MENILHVLRVVKRVKANDSTNDANGFLLGKAYKLGLSKEQGAKMTNEQVSEYIARHSKKEAQQSKSSAQSSKESSKKEEKHSKKIEEALEIGPVPSHMRYAGNYNLRVRNKEEFEEVKQELAARGYEAKYEPNPYTRQNVFFKKKTEEGSKKESSKKEATNQYRTPEDMVEAELKKLGKTDEDIKKLTRADYDYYAQVFSKILGISFKNDEGFHNTRYINKHKHDSVNDALTIEEIDALIEEELQAIASYEAALKVAVSPQAIAKLQHILKEEQEHVQELQALKAKMTQDSNDDVYTIKNEAGHYVVYKRNQRLCSCDTIQEAIKEIDEDAGYKR